MWESKAILRYICNKHSLEQWYPADYKKRGVCDLGLDFYFTWATDVFYKVLYPAAGFAGPVEPSVLEAAEVERTPCSVVRGQADSCVHMQTRVNKCASVYTIVHSNTYVRMHLQVCMEAHKRASKEAHTRAVARMCVRACVRECVSLRAS